MSEQKEEKMDNFKIFIAWFLCGFLSIIAPIPGSAVGFYTVVTPIWFIIWLGFMIAGH